MPDKGTESDKTEAGSHHVSIVTTSVAFALSRGHSLAEIEAAPGRAIPLSLTRSFG
ncbi:MAG: hypothetical protein ACFBSD_12535 [Paracoccaceae bacterium]